VINYSLGRGQKGPTIHLEDYEVFLLYINKFNTNLGRICFYFSGVLGGVAMVLEESSTCVSYLHKQTPFPYGLRSNYFGIRSSHPGSRRYRPISRPIFLLDRFYSFIYLYQYHLVYQL
jgi:hypothetical protein